MRDRRLPDDPLRHTGYMTALLRLYFWVCRR